ncbi:MAG: hypothetical protein IJ774_12490, partial [Selenomonadaceae bacterium]|nr:hypothetical protein [Selenomonadaceae bacterium]
MFKRTIAAVMILAVTLCLNFVAEAKQNFGNGNGRDDFHSGSFTPSDTNAPTARVFDNGAPNDTGDQWLIYWYACGTDIESGRILFGPGTDLATNKIVLAEPTRRTGDVTRCIRELERADLSSGKVTVLMQAGGTMVWGHEKFRS